MVILYNFAIGISEINKEILDQLPELAFIPGGKVLTDKLGALPTAN